MNNYIPGRGTVFSGASPSQQNNETVYDQIARLKGSAATSVAMPLYRTVFNDIADEWNACSDEERKFIEQDVEYAQANINYAQQFNAFLIDQFGLQFVNSKYGASAEKVLLSLKNARGRYHTNAIEDVANIKRENADLQRQIKELEELINAS